MWIISGQEEDGKLAEKTYRRISGEAKAASGRLVEEICREIQHRNKYVITGGVRHC